MFREAVASKRCGRRREEIPVNKLTHSRRFAFVPLAAVAILLAVSTPGQARGAAGPGFQGGHSGGGEMHHEFDGHHDFDGHRDFDRGHGRFQFGFGPVYPYYGYYPPAYGYEAPTYWYYCPSYGAYSPSVSSCPEAWVPVRAS
jgi:hypothetical protein